MKIVITGGAGFIGSHLTEYWLEQNAEVHIMDNFRSGRREIVALFPEAVVHDMSITDREAVFSVMNNADYVHHLAAMISVPESMEKPLECVDINVNGLINVLDAARAAGVKKVVHSSSAAVYGDNPASPKNVQMRPEPKSPYGITKLDGEYYLNMYNEAFGLGTVSLRYFNVFGPRQDPKSQYAAAIPIFVSRALKNEDLVIYGDGEQTRDFVYVKDVVQANIKAATGEATGVYNVANGYAISIRELCALIIETTGSKSKIVYAEERPGDIKHSLADITETRQGLGFDPRFDLISGLKQTITYFADLFRQQG
ncbi:MAG: NAD-dependent epimerase/dehydratase family protein [Calditrichaeota bacterium]|nr:MAG: NAD-dependent epimerase/dehydratase family protein [Calditrichota bacterium]